MRGSRHERVSVRIRRTRQNEFNIRGISGNAHRLACSPAPTQEPGGSSEKSGRTNISGGCSASRAQPSNSGIPLISGTACWEHTDAPSVEDQFAWRSSSLVFPDISGGRALRLASYGSTKTSAATPVSVPSARAAVGKRMGGSAESEKRSAGNADSVPREDIMLRWPQRGTDRRHPEHMLHSDRNPR